MALPEYLSIQSDHPTSDLLVITDTDLGPYTSNPTGYIRDEETAWGSPTRLPQYASSIDTDGPTLTGVSMGPREAQMPIWCVGTTKNQMVQRLQALENVVENISHYRGGWLKVRRKGMSSEVSFRIVFADLQNLFDKRGARAFAQRTSLTLVCKPYGEVPGDAVVSSYGTIPIPGVRSVVAPGGDADAKLEFVIEPNPFLMFASWPTQGQRQYVHNTGFENGTTVGWSVAAAASALTVAATSITATTSTGAQSGAFSGQVVTPATLNSGAHCRVYGMFRVGVPYTFSVWVKATSGSTPVSVGMGRSPADYEVTAGAALTTSWVQRTVTWFPADNYHWADVFVRTGAATATTLYVDTALVYEGGVAPATTVAGDPPFGKFSMANAEVLTAGTVQSVGWDRTGYAVLSSTGSVTAALQIVPELARDAAIEGVLLVEYWAYVRIETTVTAPTLLVYISYPTVINEEVTRINPQEFLSTTRTLPQQAVAGQIYRWLKLGTFAVPVENTGYTRRLLHVSLGGLGATSGGIGSIIGVPALSRASRPTGPDAPVYPSAGSTVSVSGETLIVRSPSGDIPPQILGGAPLRIPSTGGEVLFWGDDQTPDQASNAAGVPNLTSAVVVTATPRVSIQQVD